MLSWLTWLQHPLGQKIRKFSSNLLDERQQLLYYEVVYQLRLFMLLLRPSLFSLLCTTAVVLLVLGTSNWSYVTHSPLLYDYFFGRYGVTAALQQPHKDPFLAFSHIFDQTYTYNIVVLLVAILAGLLMYIVLEGFSHGLAGAKESIDEIEEAHGASRLVVEEEVGTQWSVRIVSLVIWAGYWIFFINALLPFCILTTRTGVGQLDMWSGWLYNLLGFGLLWLAVHMHVVFARLIVLRPRLFGGINAITAAMYKS